MKRPGFPPSDPKAFACPATIYLINERSPRSCNEGGHMHIFRRRNYTLGVLTGLIAIAALIVLAANRPQRVDAQQEIFLDWADGPEKCSTGIFAPPANCATWNEISPNF